MPIEDLLKLVETLRRRIDEHGAALRNSEALTRYALIDPLLRELGWDTENPTIVVPEYRAPNNQIADYVLLNAGSPFIVVEAKKLGEDLRGGRALDQGILNCVRTGSKFFLLTDGRVWEIFESGSDAPKISFDLKDPSVGEVCLKTMALWRPSVASGKMTIAETPLVGFPQHDPNPTPPSPVPLPPPPNGDRQPLTDVKVKRAQKVLEIQFPNGELVKLKHKTWVTTVREMVKWLIDNGNLNATNCPIKSHKRKSKHYLVNTKPVHQDEKPFGWSTEINGIHVKHYGYLHDNRDAAVTIIQHVGMDPTQFKVLIS